MKKISPHLPKTVICFLIIITTLNAFAQKDTAKVQQANKNKISRAWNAAYPIVKQVVLDTNHIIPNYPYFKSWALDARDIVTSPFHWKGKQWLTVAAVLGVDYIISTQDRTVRDFALKYRTETTKQITRLDLEPWGSGNFSIPLMGLFYLYGTLHKKDHRSQRVALLGVKALYLSNIFVTIPQLTIHRHRPCQYYYDGTPNLTKEKCLNDSQYNFDGPFASGTDFHSLKSIVDGFSKEGIYHSFPSNHSISAFAVATIIASEYKDHPIVPVIAYTIASLTGISRIEANKHWASDVFMGAALGYGIGKLIYNRNNWKMKIAPVVSNGTTSLYINIPIN